MTVVKTPSAPKFKTKAFTNIARDLAGQYGKQASAPPPKKRYPRVAVKDPGPTTLSRPSSGPLSSIPRPPPKESSPRRTIDLDSYTRRPTGLQTPTSRSNPPIQSAPAAKGVTSIPTGGQSPSFVAAVNVEPRTANAGSRAEINAMNDAFASEVADLEKRRAARNKIASQLGGYYGGRRPVRMMANGGPLQREREFEIMQEEYDAEVAKAGGSGAGLAGFLANLRDLALGDETMGLMDIMRRGGAQNVPEGYYSERIEMYGDDPRMFDIPEELLIAAGIMGPGKGKGITSLIDEAKGVSRLGDDLAESIRTKKPAIESPERGRDFDREPMTGPEFLGYGKKDREMMKMRDALNTKPGKTRGASPEEILEGMRRGRSKPRSSSAPDYRGRKPERRAGGGKPGLYANIHAKRKRIAAGSGERMRRKGEKGAPTAENFRQAAKTAKKAGGGHLMNMGYYGKSYR